MRHHSNAIKHAALASFFISCCLVFGQDHAAAARRAPVQSLASLSDSLEGLTAQVRSSVVQVFSTGYAAPDDSDSDKGSSLLAREHSTGSGVIVDPDGYVVTNAHVVRGAQRIQVRLPAVRQETPGHHSILRPEGQMLEAKLLGMDRETDVALLKIDVGSLPALPIGDSDSLRQGQVVLAFGNPMGLEGSVSMGVVSSVARQIRPDDNMIYIQTDAPINPGNSGGPLVDTNGRVMGINTFILSQSGGSEGLGFAIPSNIVRSVYDQLRKEGHVHRGMIGLYAQTITPSLVKGLQLQRDWGVLVSDVLPGGPADTAGVKIGDIVLSLNGKAMENARQLDVNVYREAMHEKVRLELLRGTQRVSAEVPVIDVPGDPERFADMVTPAKNLVQRLGVLGIGIDKEIAAMVPDLRNPYGVIVAAGRAIDVSSGTGLKPGDVIYSVDGQPIRTVVDLRQKLEPMKTGDTPVLQIERSGHMMFVTAEVQ